MPLPSFYEKGEQTHVVDSIEKEKKEKLSRLKCLSSDERKALFNKLAIDDKKNCLVDVQKKQPVTAGDIEDAWYTKNGKSLSHEELLKIKNETSHYTSTAKYYSWIRKGDMLYLREFDDKFRETNKSYSQVVEKNDLLILIKGEQVLENKGITTFKAFIETKKS